jgi:fructokinase
VIGGGVGLGRPGLLPLIRTATAAALNGYVADMSEERLGEIIRHPALGADAGPLGAAAIAQDALEGTVRID